MESTEDIYTNVYQWELRNVVREFKEKYPDYEGLNGMQMRGVLKGDLVIVPVKYTHKYKLWSKEDILAGKIDAIDARIRKFNSEVRCLNRERQAAFSAAISEMRGAIDTSLLVDCLHKIVKLKVV